MTKRPAYDKDLPRRYWRSLGQDDLNNKALMTLPAELLSVWWKLGNIASVSRGGIVRDNIDDLAFRLHMEAGTLTAAVAQLVRRGVLTRVQDGLKLADWEIRYGAQTDSIRKRNSRARLSQNVTETSQCPSYSIPSLTSTVTVDRSSCPGKVDLSVSVNGKNVRAGTGASGHAGTGASGQVRVIEGGRSCP